MSEWKEVEVEVRGLLIPLVIFVLGILTGMALSA